jgi:hypothetical protein
MKACEGAQGVMYNNTDFVYMIKRSWIQRDHDLISITEQLIRLMPGRYVGIEEEEDDGVPFEEKMERLTNRFNERFIKSTQLEIEIRNNLKGLGYGE